MKELQLGISLHTISPVLDEELLDLIAQSSMATCEINPNLFDRPDGEGWRARLLDTLTQAGIKVKTFHIPYGDDTDASRLDPEGRARAILRIKDYIDQAVQLGAPMAVLHGSFEPVLDTERSQRLALLRDALQELEPYARERSFRIAVELLPRSCLGNTIPELLDLVADRDPAVIGVCLDVNHMMHRAAELPAAVRQLGRRLFTLHISDYDSVDEKHWLPGDGVIDWPALLEALAASDYEGPFNYEVVPGPRSPAEHLKAIEDNFDWLCTERRAVNR